MTKWINIYRTKPSGLIYAGTVFNREEDAVGASKLLTPSGDFVQTISFEVADAPAVPVGEEKL